MSITTEYLYIIKYEKSYRQVEFVEFYALYPNFLTCLGIGLMRLSQRTKYNGSHLRQLVFLL